MSLHKSCTYAPHLRPTLLALSMLSLVALLSCGKDDDNDDAAPAANPTPTKAPVAVATPTVAATAVDTRATGFWISSSSLRVISRYDLNGAIKTPLIDLKAVLGANGGITALTFLDATNLLVFFDPDATGKPESVALVDAKKGVVKNKAWFTDGTNLSDVKSYSIVTGFIANTALIPNGTKILRLYYDTALNPSATGSVWLSGTTLSGCPFTRIENLQSVTVSGKKYLFLTGANDAEMRVNVISLAAGEPQCVQSYVTSAEGQPTGAADLPVNVVRMTDGRIYALFQNATKSKIVSYAFNGKALTGAKLVFSDQDILGALPRGLAARSSLRMLVGNTDDDKVCEVTTAGAFSGFCVNNSFTQDVSAIVPQ